MAVTLNIFRSWRSPRRVIAGMLAQPVREDRAFAYLMAACFLIFIGQLPRLSRLAAGIDLAPGTEAPPLDRLVAYEFFSWMVIWPLMMYFLSAVSRIVAKLFGGQGTPYRARLALFWALLASTPALLLYGLTVAFTGQSAAASLVGAVWVVGFAAIWLISLREAERAT